MKQKQDRYLINFCLSWIGNWATTKIAGPVSESVSVTLTSAVISRCISPVTPESLITPESISTRLISVKITTRMQHVILRLLFFSQQVPDFLTMGKHFFKHFPAYVIFFNNIGGGLAFFSKGSHRFLMTCFQVGNFCFLFIT